MPLSFPAAPADVVQPGYHNLLAWTYDPMLSSSNAAMGSGFIQYQKIWLPRPGQYTLRNIIIAIQSAGATLTANQNLAGLYDSGGTQIGITADQSGVWTSTGIKTMALTANALVNGGPNVWIYVALLSVGTTPPTLRRGLGDNLLSNVGLAAADGYRCAASGSGQTALPASITVSALSTTSLTYWAGLS